MKEFCFAVLLSLCAACARTPPVLETTVDIKGQPGIEFTGYLVGADGKSIDIQGTTPWRFSHAVARTSTDGTSHKDESSSVNSVRISEVVSRDSSIGPVRIAKLKVTRTKGEGQLRVSIGEAGALVFDAEEADPKKDIVYPKP